jgi:hypothetical protein
MFVGRLVITDTQHAVEAYRREMVDPNYGWPNIIIIVDPEMPRLASIVPPATAEIAARLAGFSLVKDFQMPDGRHARIWWFPRGNVLSGQHAYLVP